VVGAIIPWNAPVLLGALKIAPALCAGNTIVLKAAEDAPLGVLLMSEICEEFLPRGVLNVLTGLGEECGGPLAGHPLVRKLSFTGSTEVGRQLLEQSAAQVLRVSMELGGNAPFLVFEDADLDAAVEGAMLAKMRNMGEACTSANRFHVAAPVAADFVDRLAARMAALKVGRGTEPDVQVGPLIDSAGRAKVAELVEDATRVGARVVVGGQPSPGPGYFFLPTVLKDVPPGARVLREEIFGPVAPVSVFTSDEEAIAAANQTEFGLVAYVFTADLKRAFNVIEQLETGMVGLNQGIVSNAAAPFGGVKQSGVGREGGSEGIKEYLEIKYVALNV